jgi:hypothetical protein
MQFLSNLLAEARGSLNGTVFSRNKAGAYTRGRTKPVNPNTPAQSATRATFAAISFAWSELTFNQVIDWNAFAQTLTRINKLGQPYVPSGRQMFMEINRNYVAVREGDFATRSAPPTNATSPAFMDGTFVFAGGVGAGSVNALTLDITQDITGNRVIVQASNVMGPGRQATSVPYKQVGIFEEGANLLPAYQAMFSTAAIAGNLIHFRLRTVDVTTGVSGGWTYFTLELIAGP